MIAEGTVADGPNGQTAVFTGGKWIVQGSPAMSATISKPDQDALGVMNQDLVAKQALATRAQQFMAAQGTGPNAVATGPGYGHIKLPLLGDLGSPGLFARSVVDGLTGDDQASRLQSMDSIANQTWPLMRPAGQGRLLQTEATAFKKAFPSTENWGPTNQAAAARFQKEAADAAAQTTFVQAYVKSGKGSVADALKAYSAAPQQAAPAPAAAAPAPGGVSVYHYDAQGRRIR